MRHHHSHDPFRRHHRKDADPSTRHDHGHPRQTRHGRRPFDYGDLRLLVLWMIADRPRHGYEIIKDIADRFGGNYSPSPGVIYPTLSWLEDMGYIAITPSEGGRKLAHVLPEGTSFLAANHALVTALLQRRLADAEVDAISAAMDAVKMALRAQRAAAVSGDVSGDASGGGADIDAIAAILNAAAASIAALKPRGAASAPADGD